MKKLIGYILVASAGLSACEKKLDQKPISLVTTETFYSLQSDFVQGVNAAYNALIPYPDRQLNLSETRSDNLYAVSDGGVRDWDPINGFYKAIASNTYVTEAWGGNYAGIYRANLVLDQLDKRGTIVTDTALRKRLKAEARFIRAFCYFDLVRWFGKVPLIDKPLATVDEALTIGRSSVSDVYNFIISDLKFAADSLPATYTAAADKGRVTKYGAKGILALVYMTRSAPTYNITGPGLNSNEWGTALSLLNEIIASGSYSFLSTYASIFSYTNEYNAEVIFDIQAISGQTPIVGSSFPWVLVPDAYFTANSKVAMGGLTIRPVSNDLLSSYETGDIRKAFSIQAGYVNTSTGATESRSFFKKYLDLTKAPTSTANAKDWPINFIVLRYTDVLMLKAECILRGATPGTQSDVDGIVNQVRGRAGLGTISNVTLARLFEERRKEFAAEGSRWHDLVRSGTIDTKMTAWIAADDVQKAIQPFQTNYIIYPVPQSELDVKPGLYDQNTGY